MDHELFEVFKHPTPFLGKKWAVQFPHGIEAYRTKRKATSVATGLKSIQVQHEAVDKTLQQVDETRKLYRDNGERIYPADYTLDEWLWLRRGWLDPRGDKEYWERAQRSALGPNPCHCRNEDVPCPVHAIYVTGVKHA